MQTSHTQETGNKMEVREMRRTWVAVGDTNDTTVTPAEKNTDPTPSRFFNDPMVLVEDITQHKWMNDHLLDHHHW